MQLDLDKKDLISLVKGTEPAYSVMSAPLIRDNGRHNDNRGWEWNRHSLERLTEEQLFEIYTICKNS